MNLPAKVYTIDDAKRKLERYCVYQERCHFEVVNKLKEMRMIPQAIDIVLVHLISHNFLNEERYAKAYTRGKFNAKKWGRVRITIELKRKQITLYNIKIALQELDETNYINTFNALAEKKEATIKETNVYKKRKKLADYLLYRGWESHLVYEKVNALVK